MENPQKLLKFKWFHYMFKWTTTARVMYMVVVFERKETKKWTVLLCSWMRMIHLLQNLHAFLYKWFPIYRNNHVLLQYLSPKLLYQHENTHTANHDHVVTWWRWLFKKISLFFLMRPYPRPHWHGHVQETLLWKYLTAF